MSDSGSSDAGLTSSFCGSDPLREPGGRVALVWARAVSRRCAGGVCERVLFGRVDLDNLAPDKEVNVVYRDRPDGAWREVPAVWHSMVDPGRERWYFETPPLAAPEGGALELFVEYRSTAGALLDGTAERPHCLEGDGVAFGDADFVLTDLRLRGGHLSGVVQARDETVRAVAMRFTTDGWTTQHTVAASPVGTRHELEVDVASGVDEIELAISAEVGSETVWDNHFGDNYVLRPRLLPLLGAWDLDVGGAPSWIELRDGIGWAPGRFVGAVGSTRPVFSVAGSAATAVLSIPVQFEARSTPIPFSLSRAGEGLAGSTDDGAGTTLAVSGARAPELERTVSAWSAPSELFDGASLSGWSPDSSASAWSVEAGILHNGAAAANLVSAASYEDFRLELDYRLPPGGNSGVYLRGRYEIQLLHGADGDRPSAWRSGGLYGWIAPRTLRGASADTWHSLVVTLVGRRLTVEIDGAVVIDQQRITAITGGALDPDEGLPGPIVLQGDHTPVDFRAIRIATPR